MQNEYLSDKTFIIVDQLLCLKDSHDYVGAVSATDKYHAQVFSEEQMDLLLDRSDLAWETNNFFQVVEVDDKKPDLGSVRDKE